MRSVVLAVLLICGLASFSFALTFNPLGTASAPVNVGIATPVKVKAGSNATVAAAISPRSSTIWCTAGGVNDTAPANVPAVGIGIAIDAGQWLMMRPNVHDDANVKNRIDCIAQGAATDVLVVVEP